MAEPAALPPLEDPGLAARLAALARPLAAPAGAVLFRPGDPCRGFVMLRAGTVRVELLAEDGQALLLYRLRPGEACAMTTACLFAAEAYSAEGVAETALSGALLPAPAFHALMGESEGFRRLVLAGFAARMAALLARIEALSFRPVDRRLAALLLDGGEGTELRATQAEIAAEIGTAREVVTRRLQALARRGLVAVERGAVRVLDAEGLRRLEAGEGDGGGAG
jgi:CRP/FNR family transcriptional regulator